MAFKKIKETGVVINTDSFEEYQKSRKAVMKARKKEQEKLVETQGELHNVKEELAELKNMILKHMTGNRE